MFNTGISFHLNLMAALSEPMLMAELLRSLPNRIMQACPLPSHHPSSLELFEVLAILSLTCLMLDHKLPSAYSGFDVATTWARQATNELPTFLLPAFFLTGLSLVEKKM